MKVTIVTKNVVRLRVKVLNWLEEIDVTKEAATVSRRGHLEHLTLILVKK